MEIGRSDVRHTQRDHTASLGRHGVWAPGAKPIWASGDVPRQQAGNTTAVAPIAKFLHKTSCIKGAVQTRDLRRRANAGHGSLQRTGDYAAKRFHHIRDGTAAGGKVVHVDRVESVYMPDAGVAMQALASGEVDLDESPPTDLLALVEGNPDVKIVPNDPQGYVLFMVLNHLQPPFDKKEVRQALLWGTKQEDYLAAMIGDPKRYQVCVAIYGCGMPNESKAGAEPLLSYDLEKAKSMIKAAGAAGAQITLMDPTDNSLHKGALVAAQSLRRMGFDVEVQAMDWSTLVQRRASKAAPDKGGWNVFVTNATTTGIANPLINNFARNCEHSWYGWPCDQKIVEDSKKWALETDPAKRKTLIDELQRVHLDNVTYVPLGKYRPAIIFRKELSGIIPAPAIFYWNIVKKSD